ncbi:MULTISPECIES: hypothetical protein [Pectobacterium]|uniref:hypothetical protein n=1 Tax=Pectobacterium TaxID=122277 RepID=UPI0004735BC6|nr:MULTISPECIES: hypothetical protein [Pectobacterium]KHT18895.1 hypothetical protein RC97_08230 [Pectobacterium brasiliense]PWD56941.1 hypothetical protein DF211_21175 [Pectobacterium parmentieri]
MKIFLLVFAVLNVIGYLWLFNFYDSQDKTHETIAIGFLAISMQILQLPGIILEWLNRKSD